MPAIRIDIRVPPHGRWTWRQLTAELVEGEVMKIWIDGKPQSPDIGAVEYVEDNAGVMEGHKP